MSEVKRQMSEDGSLRSEVKRQMSEDREQMSEDRTENRDQRSEVRFHQLDLIKNGAGFLSALFRMPDLPLVNPPSGCGPMYRHYLFVPLLKFFGSH